MKGLVVIPFHNEGQVAELYSEELILTFQSSNHINVDFYLANDFSSDDTKNYLDSIKNKYNNVVIQNNKENLGHGKTVVNGYLYAIENNYQYSKCIHAISHFSTSSKSSDPTDISVQIRPT